MPARGEVQFMPIPHEGLAPGPNYRRSFDDTTIAELADSIATHGLLQNLVVTRPLDPSGAWIIVSGERRWRAIGKLIEDRRWPAERMIPCQLREELCGQAADIRITALIENLQREEVNAMEEAEAYAEIRRLDPERYTTAVIATAIGKTARYVQQRLALAEKLPEDVKAKVREGIISVTQARELTIVAGDVQRQLANMATDNASAETLRTRALASMFDLSLARFDQFDYTGPIHTDDAGGRWAIDRKAALELQRAWAEARAKELGSGVLVVPAWWRPASYANNSGNWRQAQPGEKKPVTLVTISEQTGSIWEHTGMTNAPMPDAPPLPKAAKPKKLTPAQAAKQAADEAHMTALQAWSKKHLPTIEEMPPHQLAAALPKLSTAALAWLRRAIFMELDNADDLQCDAWNMEEHEVPAGAADLLTALGLPLPAEVRVGEGSEAEANPVREEAA
jgi:ParB family transcriptional regulator, chromosome partitioning protein